MVLLILPLTHWLTAIKQTIQTYDNEMLKILR